MLDKDLVPVTNRYAIVESRLNSFMHGYVLGIPIEMLHFNFSSLFFNSIFVFDYYTYTFL